MKTFAQFLNEETNANTFEINVPYAEDAIDKLKDVV